MLPEGFCDITHITPDSNKISAQIRWNSHHEIFRGHFPGQPVVPGVLQMALVNTVMRKVAQKDLFLKNTGQIKFMAMIDPLMFQESTLEIEFLHADDQYTTGAVLKSGDTVFLKMSATYISKFEE